MAKKYPVVEGGKKTEGDKVICNGCGKELVGKMVLHWDGPKYYGYKWKCDECGSVVSLTFRREKDELEVWK